METLLKKWFYLGKHLGVLRFFFKFYFFLYEFNFNTLIRSRNVIKNLGIKRGEIIFDAGCGVGLDCLRIASKGAYVIGGDILPVFKYSLRLSNSKLLKSIDFIIMDLRFIPIKSEIFDKIICADVLEHIVDDEKVLAEFQRILRDKGKLLIHVPNLMRFAILENSRSIKEKDVARSRWGHVRDGYFLNELLSLLRKFDIQVSDYIYTFGFWSRVASNFSRVFRNKILFFPLIFFLALLDKGSRNCAYNGGILIKGEKD
jgi:SAM-dependent methyltransferase